MIIKWQILFLNTNVTNTTGAGGQPGGGEHLSARGNQTWVGGPHFRPFHHCIDFCLEDELGKWLPLGKYYSVKWKETVSAKRPEHPRARISTPRSRTSEHA